MAGTLIANTINTDTGVYTTLNALNGVAKAWVQFNGSTSTINASFNVTSLTKNGTGNYTLNLTNALSNANYAITGFADVSGAKVAVYGPATGTPTTTTNFTINTSTGGGATGLSDVTYCSVIAFSN